MKSKIWYVNEKCYECHHTEIIVGALALIVETPPQCPRCGGHRTVMQAKTIDKLSIYAAR